MMIMVIATLRGRANRRGRGRSTVLLLPAAAHSPAVAAARRRAAASGHPSKASVRTFRLSRSQSLSQ
jgi:hypothetical protein